MRPLLPVFVFALLLSVCAGRPEGLKGTTVIVVRHAEKVDNSADPDLNEVGRKRALSLARLLSEADIAALFSSQYKRTQRTLAPLASALDLEILTVDASMTKKLVRRIREEFPGKTVVVASHSDKVTEIIETLGGPSVGYLDESEYDSLFIATLLDDSIARVVQLKY